LQAAQKRAEAAEARLREVEACSSALERERDEARERYRVAEARLREVDDAYERIAAALADDDDDPGCAGPAEVHRVSGTPGAGREKAWEAPGVPSMEEIVQPSSAEVVESLKRQIRSAEQRAEAAETLVISHEGHIEKLEAKYQDARNAIATLTAERDDYKAGASAEAREGDRQRVGAVSMAEVKRLREAIRWWHNMAVRRGAELDRSEARLREVEAEREKLRTDRLADQEREADLADGRREARERCSALREKSRG
jgi:chromosome segregation ATPase